MIYLSMERVKALMGVLLLSVLMIMIVGCGVEEDGRQGGEEDANVTIKLLGSGGLTEESIEDGYVKPFTEKTGHAVVQESPNTFGKIEAMMKSGQNTYDIFALDGGVTLKLAVEKGFIEELDWDKITTEPILDEAKHSHGFGFQFVSTVMAWGEDATPLNTWNDFWNVEKYPGKRALVDDPVYVLPIALLADGVSMDELFPLDVDRAFNSLEKIKPHISVWWTTGAQPIQLLTDNEVDYSMAWSGRTYGNPDLGFTYNEGLLDVGYFAIAKGAKNKEVIYEFLKEASLAENQAVAAQIIPYTGASLDLDKHLPEDMMDELPTSEENYNKQFVNDPNFWSENNEAIQQRWQEFKLSVN